VTSAYHRYPSRISTTQYSVSEADCVVSITMVKNGSAAIPVVISFSTTNDTALGKLITVNYAFLLCISGA